MTDKQPDPSHDDDRSENVHGDTPQADRETVRGEQGTSSGDPHDDRDPQSG